MVEANKSAFHSIGIFHSFIKFYARYGTNEYHDKLTMNA